MEAQPLIVLNDTQDLVSATDFAHAKFTFENFNPVQSALLPLCEQDVNGLIAAATSCGKTVMSEMFASYTIRVQKKKFVFLCPLRALALEKYNDWTNPSHHFSDLKIGIYTGDFKEKDDFDQKDIIIMTSEMLNHKVRVLEGKSFVEEVGLLVSDESHMLGIEGRGPHLESALLSFSRINNTSRIILLSGTLPNVDEVANWLQSLNNKKTFIIKSTYRPCQLKIHSLTYDDQMSVRDAIAEDCCKIINKFSSDKFIVFVHVKSLGNYLVERLESRGVEAEFHNADLDSKQRQAIENKFKNDKNLRVIIATSTLAQGLNLPARRVIIAGVHRGTELVPSYDILQMCGRAGRPAFDKQGDAYILFPTNDFHNLSKICTTAWPVTSKILELSQTHEYQNFIFHLLAEIFSERITHHDQIDVWYQKTLAGFQKHKYRFGLLQETLVKLSKLSIIKYEPESGKLEIAALGKISVLFYISPFLIAAYNRNFSALFSHKEFNDLHICLALANNQENLIGSLSKEDRANMAQFLDKVSRVTTTSYPDAVLKNAFIHYRVLHGHFDPKYSSVAKGIHQDISRTIAVLQAMDNWVKKWRQKDFFRTLEKRMRYGVPAKLVNLVEIKNIGKIRAEKLYNSGFRNRSDMFSNLEKAAKVAGVNPETLKQNLEYN
jgi:helicase